MSTSSDSPTALDRFAQAVSRSGLIGRDKFRRAVEQAPRPVARDADKLAGYLVEKQYLTHFQAAKLLKGTWQGLVLGPYQILAPLGKGGMGQVYLARNEESAKSGQDSRVPPLVALKVLPPKRAKEEERTLARFLREMEMCRLVSHPHLTRTFDAGDIQGVYYIAMEYIRGEILSQSVKGGGPLLVPRAARLFSEIAAGLAHAHEKGLIHRDLKPSNIMVTPNGHAKVLDLGLALVVNEELPKDKKIVGGQGYVLGSMDYIAPEQVDDPTAVDSRADLYALGCTIYFAVTGQPPFPGGTSLEKMKRHQNELAEPLSDLNPTIPVAFSQIVEKLMEKNPGRRFRSAEQVRQALLPWIAGDAERPMDTDPLQSESEALEQLEKEQSTEPELWWDAVPVVSFEATSKHSSSTETAKLRRREKEMDDSMETAPADSLDLLEERKAHPFLVVALVVAGLAVLVGLLELLKHG